MELDEDKSQNVGNLPPVEQDPLVPGEQPVSASGEQQTSPEPSSSSPPGATQTPASESVSKEPDVPVQSVVTQSPSGRSSKFSIFIGVLIVITVAIYGFVGYLYLQNSQMKKDIADKNAPAEAPVSEVTSTPSPAPQVTAVQLEIENGSIVQVLADGSKKVLIDKKDYPSTGITGFANVVASPDYTKMCFESWPPAPEPSLYISGINGAGITEVSPNRRGCVWSADSKSIAYVNDQLEGEEVDIYIYSLQTAKEQNVTKDTVSAGTTRVYAIGALSSDGSKLSCSFTQTVVETGATPAEETPSSGNCEIDLATLKLTEL